MIFRIREILPEIDLQNLDERILRLPPKRRRKALSLTRDIDRLQSVMAYELLSDLLSQCFGIEECLLEEDLYGKPYLLGKPTLSVSLSHCPLAVMAVVAADGIVGCDVEAMSYDPEVAEVCCLPCERLRIESSDDRREEFTRIWTLKESLFKIDNTLDFETIDTMSVSGSISGRYTVEKVVRPGYIATAVSDTLSKYALSHGI